MLTYDDNSTLELVVEDSQGFHRVEKMKSVNHEITMHEIFITFGTKLKEPSLTNGNSGTSEND